MVAPSLPTHQMGEIKTCAKHGVDLGGGSPLHTVETGSVSLGKGVHREVEFEGSR
jgi:hypothetical protein